jgi:hypothetical protein
MSAAPDRLRLIEAKARAKRMGYRYSYTSWSHTWTVTRGTPARDNYESGFASCSCRNRTKYCISAHPDVFVGTTPASSDYAQSEPMTFEEFEVFEF